MTLTKVEVGGGYFLEHKHKKRLWMKSYLIREILRAELIRHTLVLLTNRSP